MLNNEKVSVNIISNDALRGKPYLDIDRIIEKVERGNTSNEKKLKQ